MLDDSNILGVVPPSVESDENDNQQKLLRMFNLLSADEKNDVLRLLDAFIKFSE